MKRQSMLPTLPEHPYFCLPESVGRYWREPEHAVERNAGMLNNFNIHYVASGRGFVEIEGKTHPLERGDAVLYFPMQKQRYYSSAEDPWDVRWVHFYGHALSEFLTERGFHQSQLWTLRRTREFEEMHLGLLEEAESHGILHASRLSTLTYAIIAEFVSQASPLSMNRKTDASERVLRLMPRMQAEACRPFALQDWAERAEVSPYYFCKLFKRIAQMSPMDFITLCRLQSAKQRLLEQRGATIRDIALSCGYPSVSYFNKLFLERESMTPGQYRLLYTKRES